MNDDPNSSPGPPPQPSPDQRPLDYRTPGAEPKSQWWTDDQPGQVWVIGCLLVLTGLGAIGSAIVGVVSLFLGC
jgi:hypothetical protein